MTVAHAYRREGATRLAIVCDGCAAALVGPAYLRSTWHELWRQASDRGWRGSIRPAGPHRCAACHDDGLRLR